MSFAGLVEPNNREEIRVLASISAGFAQNIMCAYNGGACSIGVHTSR
jgi:hypothetical protein